MSEFITAGYFLIRVTPRPEWLSTELPSSLLSASRCICPQFPGSYAYTVWRGVKKERPKKFDEIGIPPSRRQEAMKWASENFGETFGWTNTFFGVDDALSARNRFFEKSDQIAVVGLGLHASLIATFFKTCRSNRTGETLEPTGLMQMIDRRVSLAAAGEPLGYELLNTTYGLLNCSWFCFELEKKLKTRLDFLLNPLGLLTTFEDAQHCYEYLEQLELDSDTEGWKDLKTDPGPWLPWRLVRYD